jgi:hypothetical protein
MQLRNHPKIKWPPLWFGSSDLGAIFPLIDEGVLKEVTLEPAYGSNPAQIKLSNQFKDYIFTGLLDCDDPALLEPLYQTLSQCCGQELSQVGDLEISQ